MRLVLFVVVVGRLFHSFCFFHARCLSIILLLLRFIFVVYFRLFCCSPWREQKKKNERLVFMNLMCRGMRTRFNIQWKSTSIIILLTTQNDSRLLRVYYENVILNWKTYQQLQLNTLYCVYSVTDLQLNWTFAVWTLCSTFITFCSVGGLSGISFDIKFHSNIDCGAVFVWKSIVPSGRFWSKFSTA